MLSVAWLLFNELREEIDSAERCLGRSVSPLEQVSTTSFGYAMCMS